MENITYTVVTRDACEHHNLTAETIKDWYLRRLLGEDSLVYSSGTQKWAMLKRVFNIADWKMPQIQSVANNSSQTPIESDKIAESSQKAFSALENSSFGHLPAKNWQQSQSQTNYYSDQGAHEYQRFRQNQVFVQPDLRFGAKTAAVLLCINALVYILQIIIISVFQSGTENSSERVGENVGRFIVPLTIDLLVANYLWKEVNSDKWRKIAMIRAALGFVVFGVVFPGIMAASIGIRTPVVLLFVYASLCCVPFFILLWGIKAASNQRVLIGASTFALSFVVLGVLVFGFTIPNTQATAQLKKNELPGLAFTDSVTGTKIEMPTGWKLVNPEFSDSPSRDAKMFAYNPANGGFAMLEIVFLGQRTVNYNLRDGMFGVLDQLRETSDKKSDIIRTEWFERMVVNETRVSNQRAMIAIVKRKVKNEEIMSHIILTTTPDHVLILQEWCLSRDYSNASKDFTKLETSIFLP